MDRASLPWWASIFGKVSTPHPPRAVLLSNELGNCCCKLQQLKRFFFVSFITPRKFNIAPEKVPSQKESSLPTIIFQGLC